MPALQCSTVDGLKASTVDGTPTVINGHPAEAGGFAGWTLVDGRGV